MIIPSDLNHPGGPHVNAIHTYAPEQTVHPVLSKFHQRRDPEGVVAIRLSLRPKLDGEGRRCDCEE